MKNNISLIAAVLLRFDVDILSKTLLDSKINGNQNLGIE